MARASISPAFVLVHGAWHGAWTYQRVTPLLAARGHAAVALDLPAHGLDARSPASFRRRPLDAAAFATEPSPVAGTTLQDYADRVLQIIDQVRGLGHEKVVLVGHSMGGIAITAAAEQAPERIDALVYLTAFMPASGVPTVHYIQSPENEGQQVTRLFKADPAAVGALRMDTASGDAAERATLKLAFYADVDDAQFDTIAQLLTPDVPAAPAATPIATTRERWGALPRHYVTCQQDMAIRPALQQRFIREADAFTPDNRTRVHALDSSHSPFFSMPDRLAALLSEIAGG